MTSALCLKCKRCEELGKSKNPNTSHSNKGGAWYGAIIHTGYKKGLANEDECSLVAKTRTALQGSDELTLWHMI